MSTTFLELSDTMLRAEEVQTSRRLVQKIQNATQRVLDTARDVAEEDGEEVEPDDEPYQKHEDQDGEPVFEKLLVPENDHYPSDLPIRPSSPPPPEQDPLQSWP